MPSSTGISQHVSSIVKLNWFIILAATLLVCCTCINSEPIDVDQLLENQVIDSYYPSILFTDDSNFVERASPRLGRAHPRLGRASPRLGRASPRLGRASPRLGRASPRLGRHASAVLFPQLNHVDRYYNGDDDTTNNHQYDIDSLIQEKRASPRLGRAI